MPPWKKIQYGDLNPEKVKAYYGGSFPVCKGRKHKYPSPKAEKSWMRLVTDALNYQRRMRYYASKGMRDKMKQVRNYRYEYLLYHCRPEQKKRRTIRNTHRKHFQEKTGTDLKGKHVHHTDPVSMSLKKAKVLTKKQHQKTHADEVNELKKKEKTLKKKAPAKKKTQSKKK